MFFAETGECRGEAGDRIVPDESGTEDTGEEETAEKQPEWEGVSRRHEYGYSS